MQPTLSGYNPQNGPAGEPNPKAKEALARMITDEVHAELGRVQEQLGVTVDEKIRECGAEAGLEIANKLNKLEWAQDPEKAKALMKIIGLEDTLRVMATCDLEHESMPGHLRTLNERVGGLEALIAEAESRRDRHAEDSLDPRAEYITLAKDRLMTDSRLRAALEVDPRLSLEYTDLTNKYLRRGPENLTSEEKALFGRGKAFQQMVRKQDYNGPWTQEAMAALAPDFTPGAGLFVSPTVDTRIRQRLTEFSPIVGLAKRVPVGSNRYEWMQETGNLPDDNVTGPHSTGGTANTEETLWEQRATDVHILEVYTPLIRAQVEDSSQDLIALLTDMAARQMGSTLSGWVVAGDGASEPWGITQDSGVTSVNTGVADEVKVASLLFLMTQLPGFYRANAQYVVGDDCYTAMVIELDGEGRPKWQPSLSDGTPPTFAGYRVSSDTHFTAATSSTIDKVTYAASTKVAAFADWSQFVVMPERHGTRFVRSEVATTPQQIDVAWFQRVGFSVDLHEAGRLLNVSA